MNILISYNWLKEYLKTDLSPEEFARRTTNAGNGVESMEFLAARYDKMVIGEVVSVCAHKDADKLRVATVDIGAQQVSIVCGGENLAQGQRVVVALPGAKVRWHGEGDLVELAVTKIRGVESHGMICAANELGFEKLPQGPRDIWDVAPLTKVKAGTSFVEAFDLDDVLFDIEVTTNRPDAKSVIGQAREGAVVSGGTFLWKPQTPQAAQQITAQLDVRVDAPDLCPHYQAVVIEDVKIGPSPWWVQKKLLLSGHRPINNLVDVTNLILHEYGQPLHTFDADKLEGNTIVVRRAHTGEKLVALDEVEYELDDSMLVIADGKKPVAVAGVMGGLHSGTTEKTTRVIIEAAAFDPVSVRRTARKLNLYSDSQQLFEKGLSTESTSPALARAIELISELAGGRVTSKIYSARARDYQPRVFDFDPARTNKLCGVDIAEQEQLTTLEGLGFVAEKAGEMYRVRVPYWRDHDIEHSVDFVEEIARVYGYDRIPSTLPADQLPKIVRDPALLWERRAKEVLVGLGFSEAYAFAFLSSVQLEAYGFDPKETIHLNNPLTEDQAYMRPSLIPSMLTAFAQNQRQESQIDVFEIAPVYQKDAHGGLPLQPLKLLMGSQAGDGSETFFHLKGRLERLGRELGWPTFRFEATVQESKKWHPTRTADLWLGDVCVGVLGQVSDDIAQAFDLERDVVLCELDFERLVEYATDVKAFEELSVYQDVKRDLAFVVPESTVYATLEQALRTSSSLLRDVELFDVYRGRGVDAGHKSLAFHLSFRADRTLSSEEVDVQMKQLSTMLESQFAAILRV